MTEIQDRRLYCARYIFLLACITIPFLLVLLSLSLADKEKKPSCISTLTTMVTTGPTGCLRGFAPS
ncbi:MAG: hypothetical protein GY799_15075 [Desulfobulbaceae bacterium]|nr:hypothetical protein [Desulfobulbaceae bacterium]